MTKRFDFNNPRPVAQAITHVGDGQLYQVLIARNAADVGTQGTKPGAPLDYISAWEARCAGVGSDPVSGSNIFISLDEEALESFEGITSRGVTERLRVRPLEDDPTRVVIEISGGGSSAALIVRAETLHAAKFSPKRVLLTLQEAPLRNHNPGLIGEIMQAAARNSTYATSKSGKPAAAFGEVLAAFELPS